MSRKRKNMVCTPDGEELTENHEIMSEWTNASMTEDDQSFKNRVTFTFNPLETDVTALNSHLSITYKLLQAIEKQFF